MTGNKPSRKSQIPNDPINRAPESSLAIIGLNGSKKNYEAFDALETHPDRGQRVYNTLLEIVTAIMAVRSRWPLLAKATSTPGSPGNLEQWFECWASGGGTVLRC